MAARTAAIAAAAAGLAALAYLKMRRSKRSSSSGDAAVGVVGLGVMGSQLVLNFAEKLKRPIAGFDLDEKKVSSTMTAAKEEGGFIVRASTSLADFVSSLERPRRVLLLVPAGKPVEAAIDSLLPLLSPGDVIVDMGNEWFHATEARQKRVAPTGIHYVGCGLSGGGEGARRGPCMLPGGPRESWELLKPVLEVRTHSAFHPHPSSSNICLLSLCLCRASPRACTALPASRRVQGRRASHA